MQSLLLLLNGDEFCTGIHSQGPLVQLLRLLLLQLCAVAL
jgi:hypothetical protein